MLDIELKDFMSNNFKNFVPSKLISLKYVSSYFRPDV